jgi:hypothetical protein
MFEFSRQRYREVARVAVADRVEMQEVKKGNEEN